MASGNLIFVPGSTTFDIPQFTTLHNHLEKNQCIQSKSFTVGDYDWVIQFYPKGTTSELTTDHPNGTSSESTTDHPNGTSSQATTDDRSKIFIKVLNAKEKCSVICTPLRWDWTTSTWDRGKPEPMMINLQQSDDNRSGFIYATKQYLKVWKFCCFCKTGSKFLKDDMIRIKFDLLVTPNPTPPAAPLEPPAGTNNHN